MENYSAGELARYFGVTIRTIQYYDKCNLLKAEIGENGRRVYHNKDVLKLQQILFLKSFGFTLNEIRDRLLGVDSPTELGYILENQKMALNKKIEDLKKVVSLMDQTIQEIDPSGSVDVEGLFAIMRLINQGSSFAFVLQYLGKEEVENIMMKLGDQEEGAAFAKRNQDLLKEVIEACHNKVLPSSQKGQILAKKWWNMVYEFTGGDISMMKSLMKVGLQVDDWPQDALEFKEAVTDFLMEALAIYLKKMDLTKIMVEALQELKKGGESS